MANKYRPGLSDTFTLDVAPITDLGDYLAEVGPSPVAPKRVGEAAAPSRAAPVIRKPKVFSEPPPISSAPAFTPSTISANADAHKVGERLPPPPVVSQAAVEQSPLVESRPPRHTGPRREINMSPEALRMSEELLDLIRSGSGQRDTKANELMHALLLLAHEVKDEIDPHTLPKRGRWGTPTARAYPLEIKNALLEALRRKHVSAS